MLQSWNCLRARKFQETNMMQTLEATLDESGHIHFAEPVKISGMQRVLVTLLNTSNESGAEAPPPKSIAARGAMKGMLSSVDEFIANKGAEIALEEK
ncbi:MAG TPA: hypothetical protein VFW53_12345 [Gallionella sp.]|nr:hypothetical protein [Gallionella sp.]